MTNATQPESPASTFLRLKQTEKPNAETIMILESCVTSLNAAELKFVNSLR